MTPRFGYRSGVFREWPIERTAAELARLGYDCLELCLERPDVRPETLTEARCRELRKMLDDLGIGLASVSYHGDGDPSHLRLEAQRRAIQVARWLETKIVVINGERIVDRERQWSEHVARFGELCRMADVADVLLAVEPEPLLVVENGQEMLKMIEAVGSPRLKVNLDIGHAQVTDPDLIETILQLGPHIVHLHLEDIKDRVHKHLPFGEGDINFEAVRQALADIGYEGPYVVDLFGPGLDPLEAAKNALKALQRFFA